MLLLLWRHAWVKFIFYIRWQKLTKLESVNGFVEQVHAGYDLAAAKSTIPLMQASFK